MREAPVGWPTSLHDVQPSCTILVDGIALAKASYSIDRTASTDLPEGLTIVAGVSSASATVVVTVLDPYTHVQAADEFVGKEIIILSGYSGVEIVMFTGFVYTAKGSARSREITLSCDDMRLRAKKKVAIPPATKDMHEDDWTELNGSPKYCGLSTLWVIDRLMREAGIDSFPVYRLSTGEAPKILCRVSNQGGWFPEYGSIGLISTSWPPFGDVGVTPTGGWGIVGDNGVNWYNTRTTRSNGTTATIRIGDWIRLTACIHSDGSGGGNNSIEVGMTDGSTNEDYFRIRRDTTNIYAERRVISTNTWTTDVSLPALPGEFYIVSVIWRATTAAGQMTTDMIDHTGRTASLGVSTKAYGSFNRISRLNTNQTDVAFIDLVSSTIGNAVAAHPTTFSWEGEWKPGFKAILPQLGSWDDVIELLVTPSDLTNDKVDAWEKFREMALAEAGMLLVNEYGEIEFKARSWIEGATVGARLTAAKNLKLRNWAVSMDQFRPVIEVEYAGKEILRPQRFDPVESWVTAGRPGSEILIGRGQTRNVGIDLDGDAIGVDLSPTRGSAADTSWYYASSADTTIYDGTNANDGTLTGVSLSLSQPGSRRVLAKVTRVNTGSAADYTLSGRNGAPNSPRIAARVLVQDVDGGTVTRGSDPENLYQPFTAARTEWRQNQAEADKYVDWLESKIAPSLPVQDIEVIPNLLVQLGDIIEVQDPDDPTLVVKGGVLGVTTAGSLGSLTQSLQIRPIEIIVEADVTRTFGEFNAEWSGGQDFDDYNAYLDNIDPAMTFDEFTNLMRGGDL